MFKFVKEYEIIDAPRAQEKFDLISVDHNDSWKYSKKMSSSNKVFKLKC